MLTTSWEQKWFWSSHVKVSKMEESLPFHVFYSVPWRYARAHEQGHSGATGKERKAWRDRKSEKMHKWIADLEPAPNFKPFWCIICPNWTKNGRVRFSRVLAMCRFLFC